MTSRTTALYFVLFLNLFGSCGVAAAEHADHPVQQENRISSPSFPNAFSGLFLPSIDFSASRSLHIALADFRFHHERLRLSLNPVGLQVLYARPVWSDARVRFIGAATGGEAGFVLLKPLEVVYATTMGLLGDSRSEKAGVVFTWMHRLLLRWRFAADERMQFTVDAGWSVGYVSGGATGTPWIHGPTVGTAVVLLL